jgi:hypothetical protein
VKLPENIRKQFVKFGKQSYEARVENLVKEHGISRAEAIKRLAAISKANGKNGGRPSLEEQGKKPSAATIAKRESRARKKNKG